MTCLVALHLRYTLSMSAPDEAEHFAALVAAGPGESKATSDVTGGLGTLGSVVFLVRMVLERP